MMRLLLAVIVLISCLSSNALALTEYYMDASRDSAGDGSEASPWKSSPNWTTISNSLVTDNVTLFLSSRDDWVGAASSRFLVGASGSATYTFKIVGNEKYNLTDSGTASWQTEMTPYDDDTDSGNLAELSGGTTFDINDNNYVEVHGIFVNQSTWECFDFNDVHHVTLEGSKCYYPSSNHGFWSGYSEIGVTDLHVKDNYIEGTPLEAIYVGHSTYEADTITGVIIDGNTLKNNGLGGEGDIDIKPGVYGAIVRNNTVYRTTGVDSGSVSGIVIYGDAAQVYGNTLYGMDWDSGGTDWGFGIYLTGYGGDGAGGSDGKTINSCLIYNNLIYGNDRTGIKVQATFAAHPMSGIKILNNTIVGNGTVQDGLGIRIAASSTTITIDEFKNNIVSENYGYQLQIEGSVTLTDVDNNIYYDTDGGEPFYMGGSAKTWAEWQALGYDANGLNQDPNLSTEYLPQDNTLNFGEDLSGTFTTDIDGDTRTFWTVGVNEWVQTAFKTGLPLVQ